MYFPNQWLLITGCVLALCSLYLHYTHKFRWAVFCLFASAFLLRLFMVYLDPFLHDWDEKFHAVVAQHMIDDPLKPVLRLDPVIPYDMRPWCCNYIWLHKQPLFMWQMAFSMKIFGISEFAMRYPSALMGALMVPMLYRIAWLATGKRNLAWLAAVILCFLNYHLELISGYYGMDHNDVAFGFYILASIWAYTEYINKRKVGWVLLIGLFAGCAVMNKWLTGVLVFSAWGISILATIRKQGGKKEMMHLLLALFVCCLVFLPWQLYILQAFPAEARYEYEYNTRHLFEAVESHKGSSLFYLNKFPVYFGRYFWCLVPIGFSLIFLKQYRNRTTLSLAFYFALTFVFFSFVATTKIAAYFFIMAPIGCMLIAVVLNAFLEIKYIPRVTVWLLAPVAVLLVLDLQAINKLHDEDDEGRQVRIYNANIYRTLKDSLPDSIKIVSNCKQFEDIDVMFYNKGITAYHYDFSETEIEVINNKKLPIAVFKDHTVYTIPQHVKNYPRTYVIDRQLK